MKRGTKLAGLAYILNATKFPLLGLEPATLLHILLHIRLLISKRAALTVNR